MSNILQSRRIFTGSSGGTSPLDITVVANYSALPPANTASGKFYWCQASQGTWWLPGSLGGTYYNKGLYYSNGTTWETVETPYQATQVEVDAGLANDVFVSPNTLFNANQWTTKFDVPTGLTTQYLDGKGVPTDFGSNSGSILKGTASGTDTYTTTISTVSSLADGDAFLIRFLNGNTTGCTLDINGLGAKILYRNNDGALIGGDIWDGAEMLCVYNSTLGGFQCIGTSPNSLFAYITNADSVTITKGQVVYAFGAQGNRMTVKLANNSSDATSAKTFGVVYTSSIAPNQKGIVVVQGELDNLSILPTATWSDGDTIYLNSTSGNITPTKPYAPNHLVYVGTVITASNGNSGRMYVRIQNGYELNEIHDVDLITNTPVNKDILTYVTGTPNLWKNLSLGTILGGTTSQYVRGDGSLASLPFELSVACSDETTALTAGTNKITFRMPRAVTLTSVRASLTTAQTSGNIFTVDINEGGTSILSTKLTIDNTEKTSTTAATPPVISDTSLADDAEITIDIDQIGDSTAKGLKVTLIGTYT